MLKMKSFFATFMCITLFFTMACGCENNKKESENKSANEAQAEYYSDYDISELGNSFSNIHNYGLAATNGEYIFVAAYSGLYRISGKYSTCLTDEKTLHLNAYGDWVYYRKQNTGDFYRIKTDGTCKELYLSNISNMYIVKGKVYYVADDVLYSMNIDKTDKKIIIEHSSIDYNLNITKDKIYWGNNINLYESDLDGSNFKEYKDVFSQHLIIYKNKKYTSGTLKKSNIDGSDSESLCESDAMGINLYNDWVYFSNSRDEDCLYRIKTDGTNLQKLTDISANGICIVGDNLFFISNASFGYATYRTDLDCTYLDLYD